MYFDIFYRNSMGQVLNLVQEPYRLQTADILDYDWNPYTESGYITDFTKSVVKKTATLTISGVTEEEYCDAANLFYETVEKDILKMSPGRLYVGKQYMECYIASSKKSEWEYGINQMDNEIDIITDHPEWIQETVYNFAVSKVSSSDNKRYAYQYQHRYANGMNSKEIYASHFSELNFLLRVYGPAVSPMVTIGGHPYLVNIVLEPEEYLEVDSRNGTVIKKMSTGQKVNAFSKRSFKYDVFQKIPPGMQQVNWPGSFNFDLILYAERGEPKWSRYLSQN